jgi:hypothetical protein
MPESVLFLLMPGLMVSMAGYALEKYKECGTRNFYEYVKEAEDNDLTPTVLLLKKMEAEI